MATQEKNDIVELYSQKFKDAKSIFVADFKGMNVAEANELRRTFREAGVEYKIVKNTLAKLALHKSDIKDLDSILEGPSAFAFSDQDPVAPVKVMKEFLKKNKKVNLTIKGCLFEGKFFQAEQADALAELPSREALLSQLLGVLQAPMSNLLAVLQANGSKLVGTLESVKETKSK